MRYVAAALLVSMAGNELTRANIQRILESVGVECEDDKLQIVLDQLKGKVTRPHFLIYFE
jgi:ribosomal protein L12E/L44/L45/RPP1/RPP2